MDNRKKLLIVAAVILVGVATILFFWLGNLNKVTVEVIVTPKDSNLTLDGKEIKAGKLTIEKGEHTLFASHQYFEDATIVFNTNNINPAEAILIAPNPNTPEALELLNKNEEDMLIWQRISGREADAKYDEFIQKYPITQRLPYNYIDWQITYEFSQDKVITFIVSYKPYSNPGTAEYNTEVDQYKKEALEFLKNNGVDVDKEKIIYRDFYQS